MNLPSQDLTVKRDLKATFEKAALDDHDLAPAAMVNVTVEDSENYAVGTDDEKARNKFHDETINGSGAIGAYPPRAIFLPRDGIECSPMPSNVQLGFEQRQDMIVRLLTSVGDRRSKHISWMTPASFPPLSRATTSPARSTGTVSTLTAPEGHLYSSDEEDDSNFSSLVLGQDLQMGLLTDSMKSHQPQTIGCSAALHKLPKLLGLTRRNRHERAKKKINRFAAYRPMA